MGFFAVIDLGGTSFNIRSWTKRALCFTLDINSDTCARAEKNPFLLLRVSFARIRETLTSKGRSLVYQEQLSVIAVTSAVRVQ